MPTNLAMTTYYATAIGDSQFRATPYTPPSTWYLGLNTADQTDAGTAAEVSTSGTGYARQEIAFSARGGDGYYPSSGAVEFGAALAAWPEVHSFTLYDASTGGHALLYCHLEDSDGNETTKTLGIDDTLNVAAGAFKAKFD
ncbi:MAG: hypothetical protein ABFE07_06990 [Armatimonadia bacterium]